MSKQGKNVVGISKKIEEIPTLPVISKETLALLDDPQANFSKLANLIEKDQSLALKILKVANSSFYGTLNRVGSIDHALAVLGLSEVKTILLAFSVHNFFAGDSPSAFDRIRFWKHSIICSQIAKYLEQHFNVKTDDSIFLSALIHDMGKVVLDQFFHDEFLQIVDFVSSKNETFSAAEKEIIGVTHYQIAAKVLQQWKFPRCVILHVFYHHAPWYDKNCLNGSIIVFLANYFAKCLGYSGLEHEKKVVLSSFAESNAMEFIVKNGFDIDLETMEKLLHQIKEFIAAEEANILGIFENE